MLRTPRLILIDGQEGAGKTTLIKALLPETPTSAAVDAEDVGQVNPCHYDEAFFDLLWHNIVALTHNYWRAGYINVITGSFFSNYAEYREFRELLDSACDVYIVRLLVDPAVRQHRRVTRAKQTTPEWRDHVDQLEVEDTSLRLTAGDYQYIEIDNSQQSVAETIASIKQAIPAVYNDSVSS